MAECPEALLPTAFLHSPLPGFESRPVRMGKLPVTLRTVVVFRCTPFSSTTSNWLVTICLYRAKCDSNPKF